MAKPTRKLTDAEVPLPRNRMIPLLAAIVLILAARYYSSLNAPPAVEQPAVGQPPAQHEASKTPAATEAPKSAASKPAAQAKPAASSTASGSPLVKHDLSLRDQDGRVVYRGDIDLRPTLERIDAGRRLRFSNDGSTFQNREGRLPKNPSGYYREWVVPTPGEDGPGPQRIVTGSSGEAWYTSDHYRTFQRLPSAGDKPPKDAAR